MFILLNYVGQRRVLLLVNKLKSCAKLSCISIYVHFSGEEYIAFFRFLKVSVIQKKEVENS